MTMALRYPDISPFPAQEPDSQKVPLKMVPKPTKKAIVFPSPIPNGIVRIPQEAVQSCTVEMVEAGVKMSFDPQLTRTLMDLEKFEDLDVGRIRHFISGLILSVNGPLIGKGDETFEPAVVEKLREIRAKMKVCVFPNAGEEHTLFHELGIPIVKHAAQKPDPRGIERAAYNYLDLKPHQVASVGSNPVEEVAARRAGMRVILVDPLPGKESLSYKMGRGYGRFVKGIHDKFFRGSKKPRQLSA